MIFRRSELPQLEGIVKTDYPVKTTPAHDFGHFHYNVTTRDTKFSPHKHDDFEEKWFIISGKAIVYQNGIAHEVGSGDLIVHEIGVMHSMETRDEDVHWLCMGVHP
ncbi:MAG: cupin domain-containing protein [Candidatus Latescibacteria bacterium]|nr:cupin domain-containing protein [Candidatus Latescibacterota bacterium]